MPRHETIEPFSAKKAFEAYPASAADLLTKKGRFFYIPAFQRDYSWAPKEHIARLVEDVCEGIQAILDDPSFALFLGAIILVEDHAKLHMNPVVRTQAPTGVKVIIDGQQRCSTLIIWACALVESVRARITKLEKFQEEPGFGAIMARSQQLYEVLVEMIHENQNGPKKNIYNFYPRLIRSHDDSWSRNENEKHYNSPIARLLWATSEWIRDTENKSLKIDFSLDGLSKEEIERHKPIKSAFDYLRRFTTAYAADKGDRSEDFPVIILRDAANNQAWLTALWGDIAWEPSLINAMKSPQKHLEDKGYNLIFELIRTCSLALFVTERVCFTAVEASDDGYAFDMFDALNTTGQALTAYETFRPVVISNVRVTNYRSSEEFKQLQLIDSYLFGAAIGKISAAEKLIIHSALYMHGTKLGKRMKIQRSWLVKAYEKFPSRSDQLKFLKNISNVAFCENIFSNPEKNSSYCNSSEVKLCLEILQATKHDIVVPLLACFTERIQANTEDKDVARFINEFGRVVRGVTAFATLWRCAKGGTAGIDDIFRGLMRGNTSEGHSFGPFCCFPDNAPRADISASKLLLDLKYRLKIEGLDDVEKWTRQTFQREIYKENSEYVRFLLAAAMHNSVPDSVNPGLLMVGRSGVNETLKHDAVWWREKYDIEHIAPRSGGGGWAEDIYRSSSIVDSIGNLTLLPPSVNRAIKNSAWGHKRAIFSVLCAETINSAEILKSEAVKSGDLSEFPSLQNIVDNSKHQGMLRSLLIYESWKVEDIHKRAENLCRLGFNQLWEFLS